MNNYVVRATTAKGSTYSSHVTAPGITNARSQVSTYVDVRAGMWFTIIPAVQIIFIPRDQITSIEVELCKLNKRGEIDLS